MSRPSFIDSPFPTRVEFEAYLALPPAEAAVRLEEAQSRPPPTQSVARIAVVGCGGWTQGWHLPNLQNRADARIVALIDPCDKPGVGGCIPAHCTTMDALCDKYAARRYTSLDALLSDQEAGGIEVDGIICAAPHGVHGAIGEAVLQAGMHLLMEKPMTADVAEAAKLLTLSQSRPSQAFLLNNTANWQAGAIAAAEAVASGKLGTVRHVNCVFAAPLAWLFEGEAHHCWSKPEGSMMGNGFGWGQMSHIFAWVYHVTGLTPRAVFAVHLTSEASGADLYNAVTVTCTNGAVITASGVGSCPDKGFKVVGNWVFGTKGMLSFCGLAGSDNVNVAEGEGTPMRSSQLEIWLNDGTHEIGPAVDFEHLDQGGTGPGSMDALIYACLGQPYHVGAGPLEGLKAVATIEAMYRSANTGRLEDVHGCEAL